MAARRWEQATNIMPLLNSAREFWEALEQFRDSGKLVVATFFAEDCYACKSLHPVRKGGCGWVGPGVLRSCARLGGVDCCACKSLRPARGCCGWGRPRVLQSCARLGGVECYA